MHSRARLVATEDHGARRRSQDCLLKNALCASEEVELIHMTSGGAKREWGNGEAPFMDASEPETPLALSRDVAASSKGVSGAHVSPEELLDDVRRTIVVDPASARSAALRLVMLLSASSTRDTTIIRGGLAPWQLRKIDRYLKEHLAHPLRLSALAEQINLSVSHFTRSFKASRGLTPHLYIVKLRLDLAQSLMLTTDNPLCNIALACGLADQAHLTKLFRRHFGETPAAWRRRRFNDNEAEIANDSDVKTRFGASIGRNELNAFALLDGKEHHQKPRLAPL
jgi:AraC family transcriptional regulator